MLISPTSVKQLLIDITDDEFNKGDCGEDKIRILLASSIFKNLTGAGFQTSGAKKGNQAIKKSGKGTGCCKYLTPGTKKAIKFL